MHALSLCAAARRCQATTSVPLQFYTVARSVVVCAAILVCATAPFSSPRLHLQGPFLRTGAPPGACQTFKSLALSFNFELSGQLPAQWGSDGSSLQNLTSVEITNCDLSGPLPPSWAGNLPSLTKLNVSANALSGAPVAFTLVLKHLLLTPSPCMWQQEDCTALQGLICLHASAQGSPLL